MLKAGSLGVQVPLSHAVEEASLPRMRRRATVRWLYFATVWVAPIFITFPSLRNSHPHLRCKPGPLPVHRSTRHVDNGWSRSRPALEALDRINAWSKHRSLPQAELRCDARCASAPRSVPAGGSVVQACTVPASLDSGLPQNKGSRFL